MPVNLYRITYKSWVVEYGTETEVFDTIEDACELMLKLGVSDPEIDEALIELSAHGHSRAKFGTGGNLLGTDGAKHHGTFGIA